MIGLMLLRSTSERAATGLNMIVSSNECFPYTIWGMKICYNRALKSFFFCFVISKYLLKVWNYLLFDLLVLFVKKPWNVKKCYGRSNLGTEHIKEPISISHDGANGTWRVPGDSNQCKTSFLINNSTTQASNP